MLGGNLLANYGETIAMILFGIGLSDLLLQRNLIQKIIGRPRRAISWAGRLPLW